MLLIFQIKPLQFQFVGVNFLDQSIHFYKQTNKPFAISNQTSVYYKHLQLGVKIYIQYHHFDCTVPCGERFFKKSLRNLNKGLFNK